MDRIIIRDLLLRCIIGVSEKERRHKQDVVLNLVLHTETDDAVASDELIDTVDYVSLRDDIAATVEASSFKLIETLAEHVSEVCLKKSGVHAVDVTLDKPGALTYARSVAVEIHRARRPHPATATRANRQESNAKLSVPVDECRDSTGPRGRTTAT